ncbi:MAG TPA: hypothetical protein VLJ17_11415 [Xanthobacteraceae bacterium]|nr:hypothetical protein [Xanthobacteraceae bacterium]
MLLIGISFFTQIAFLTTAMLERCAKQSSLTIYCSSLFFPPHSRTNSSPQRDDAAVCRHGQQNTDVEKLCPWPDHVSDRSCKEIAAGGRRIRIRCSGLLVLVGNLAGAI